MSEVLLKIENLNKSFGITHANVNINFELKAGEVRGLAGENGSGKSTLLSQIAGLYGSDSGKMYIRGEEYSPKNPVDANNHKVAMVVQELGMIGSLPASINIYLGKTKKFIKMNDLQDQANAVSDRWGLPRVNLKRMAGSMNIENRKMVELIRALAADPDILILDEVLSVGDARFRKKSLAKVQSMFDQGVTVLFVSHNIQQVKAICDTAILLEKGHIIASGDVDTVAAVYEEKSGKKK